MTPGPRTVTLAAVEKLKSVLAAFKMWVEAHAFPVGVAGLVALLAGGGIAVASIGGGDPQDDPGVGTTTTTEQSVPADGQTSEPPSDVSVTTMAPVAGGTPLIAVKVDNAPEARPQVGLQEASVVIEVPVEGGLTRFTALYGSGSYPALVGPVRSVRPVDDDLVGGLSSVLVSTGGQPFVLRALSGAGIAIPTSETAPGFQALERPMPHNLFVDLLQVESVYPAAPPAIELFARGDWPSGGDAASVSIPYASESRWEYVDGSYARSDAGEAFTVLSDQAGDPAQLTTDTVVVLFAAQRSAGYTDVNDADVPTFDVIGSGRLLVFHSGQVIEGTWSRSAQADPYVFMGPDGEVFGVPEGRTHVSVVPRELVVEF